MKVCPKCGSIDIVPVAGGILGTWKCRKCGFSGTLFPDVEKLEEESGKKMVKGKEKKNRGRKKK